MTDVVALIAADKATTEAATKAPWSQDYWYFVAEVPGGRPGGEVIGSAQPSVSRLKGYTEEQRLANAALVVAARNRWPVYIAAIEAITELCDESDEHEFGAHAPLIDSIRSALAVLAVPSTPNKEQQ